MYPRRTVLFFLLILLPLVPAAIAQQSQHLFFRVTLGPEEKGPVSGKVLIFLTEGTGAKEIDDNPFSPKPIYVAATEVMNLKPNESVDVDTDGMVYPRGFSTLAAGDYEAQAVLDTEHTYNYSGRSAGDLISSVIPLKGWTPGHSVAGPHEEPT